MNMIKSFLYLLYRKILGDRGYNRKNYSPKKDLNQLHQKSGKWIKSKPDRIESKSLDLLNSYSSDRGVALDNYIDPIDILEYLGYDIDYVQGKYSSSGENVVYGALHVDQKVVEINNDVSFNEGMENFTVAHEIGHIVLHADGTDQNQNEKTCSLSINENRSSIEKEADKFAGYLLMPTEKIIKAFKKVHRGPLYLKKNILVYLLKKDTPRKAAIVFANKVIKEGGFTNVSKLAMVNRLIGMGLIKGLPYQSNKRK